MNYIVKRILGCQHTGRVWSMTVCWEGVVKSLERFTHPQWSRALSDCGRFWCRSLQFAW